MIPVLPIAKQSDEDKATYAMILPAEYFTFLVVAKSESSSSSSTPAPKARSLSPSSRAAKEKSEPSDPDYKFRRLPAVRIPFFTIFFFLRCI